MRYHLLDRLGGGVHGEVWRARQEPTNRLVAVKLIASTDPEKFLREVESHARLHHSNIVQIYEAGLWGGDGEEPGESAGAVPATMFIAMQWIDGASLEPFLTHDSSRDATRAARLIAKVARAMKFAHENHILHCDLKPQNILIDRLGVPYVTDFSIAQPLDRVRSPEVAGTAAYMAPEQCRGELAERWTDVYALGTLLYQLATGQTPYPAELSHEKRLALFSEKTLPPAPSSVAAQRRWTIGRALDSDFDRICLRALAIDGPERYASTSALADDLDRWVLGWPVVEPGQVPSWRENAVRFTRRNLRALGISMLAVILALGGGLAAMIRARQELEDWILLNNRTIAELNAQLLRRGMREFRDLVPKLAEDDAVRGALSHPDRCDAAGGLELTETREWRALMSQGIWKDGPDQAYVSDTQGCFYKYWPAPGPRNVYTHWYGFRDYFECGHRLGMGKSRDTCVARVFRSEYDWYQNTLRMAFATPVYDANGVWIGVFVASWRAERPLAEIKLGKNPTLEPSVSLLVARDLERNTAEQQIETKAPVPRCDCGATQARAPVPPETFLEHLRRPDALLLVPREGSSEKFLEGEQMEAVAEAVRSDRMTLSNFVDPRDGKIKLAAFATLQPLEAPGAATPSALELAPLLMVTTDHELLERYTWWIYAMGVLLCVALLLLFQRFVWALAHSEQEKLRWLKGGEL